MFNASSDAPQRSDQSVNRVAEETAAAQLDSRESSGNAEIAQGGATSNGNQAEASPSQTGDDEADGIGDDAGPSTKKRKVKRSRSGCLTCRKRRKLCDMHRPQCQSCERLKLVSHRGTVTLGERTRFDGDGRHQRKAGKACGLQSMRFGASMGS